METSPFHLGDYMMCNLEDSCPEAALLLPLSFVGLEVCHEDKATFCAQLWDLAKPREYLC